MSQRDEQARHLECLEAELADARIKVREIRRDRDITKAWLEGHDVGYDVGYVMGRENRDPDPTPELKAALDRLRSYEPLASKAVGPAGLALGEDGAPEQDGTPDKFHPDIEEHWGYL